jgi:periplasmic copper chaperone A
MSINRPHARSIVRAGVTLAAVGVFVLAGAGIASAHVSAHSPDQLVQGGDAEIVFRSPNEEPTASLVKLQVNFSLTSPIGDAAIKPIPGWTYQLAMTTLPTPVRMTSDSISSAVQSITWTAQPGYAIKTGEFQEFDISIEGLPTNTTTMDMPAVQTYDNGDVVNWNQPTPASGVEPLHPLPELTLAAADSTGAAATGSTANMAGMTATGTPNAATGTDGTARWLGGIGLLLAALALGFGFGAFFRSRRAGSGSSGPDGGDALDDDDDDLDDSTDGDDSGADDDAPPKDERSKQGVSA